MAESLLERVERIVLSKTRHIDGYPQQDVNNLFYADDPSMMVPQCEYLIDNTGTIHPYSEALAASPKLCRPYYGNLDSELTDDLLVFERRLRMTLTAREEEEEKRKIRAELVAKEKGSKAPPPPPIRSLKNEDQQHA